MRCVEENNKVGLFREIRFGLSRRGSYLNWDWEGERKPVCGKAEKAPCADGPRCTEAPRREEYDLFWELNSEELQGIRILFQGQWEGLKQGHGMIKLIAFQKISLAAPWRLNFRATRWVKNNQLGDCAMVTSKKSEVPWEASRFRVYFGMPGPALE